MVELSDSADSNENGWRNPRSLDIVYLNNAGQAPLSDRVKQAGIRSIEHDALDPANNDQTRIREIFAKMIEAENANDIAIMPSTAFAITLAARNIQRLTPKESGKILILQDQFNSAVYPWQEICDESNGKITLEIVPHPDSERSWTDAILEKLDNDIVAACLPPLHWSDGTLIDLTKISTACAKFAVPLVVDATQAVGVMPCSIREIQPVMLACSVHKWLRGPPGTSLVYVSPEVNKTWIPLDLHGRSRDLAGGGAWDASRDEMGPKGYPEKFFPDSRKFDSGGKPNPILLPMLRASLEEVTQLNFNDVQRKLQALIDPLLDWVSNSSNYSLPIGAHVPHLFGIKPVSQTPEEVIELCGKLQERGIMVAVRCGNIRVSPYLDTSADDIKALIEGLKDFA